MEETGQRPLGETPFPQFDVRHSSRWETWMWRPAKRRHPEDRVSELYSGALGHKADMRVATESSLIGISSPPFDLRRFQIFLSGSLLGYGIHVPYREPSNAFELLMLAHLCPGNAANL